jgi:hypothetical protein
MKKLNALVDAIRAALKHRRSAERSRRSPERAKARTRGRSVCTIPCVAYATVRCREYAVVHRRKVIDRF